MKRGGTGRSFQSTDAKRRFAGLLQQRDRGIGILITDHQVRETLAIVDRAYIMNNGRIEVSGTAHEVLESPIARTFYLGEGFRL